MADWIEQGDINVTRASQGLDRRSMLQGGLFFGLAAMVGFPMSASAAVVWSHPFAERTSPSRLWGMKPDGSGWPEYSDGFHKGIDYARPAGTQIHAVAAGTVVAAGVNAACQDWAGEGVLVQHAGGWHSYYAHMSALDVASGQEVFNGSPIGKVGSTGESNGNHLHIEIWTSSSRADRTDPYPLIHDAPLPTDGGEEVPTYLDLEYDVPKTFPLEWGWARPDESNLSIASGGMVVVTSNVQISGLGSNIGKFRFVRYNATTGNEQPLEPLFIDGAGATTYGQLSAITSLGADTRLRLQMKADVSGVELTRIATRGLRWAP